MKSLTISRRRFLSLAPGAALAGMSGGRLPAAEPAYPEARAVTGGPKCHFFGYYDKCPWDATGRYLLGMEIGFCDRNPRPGEKLTVGMIDLKEGSRYLPLDATPAWSWQQGTMLQWLGSAPDREVIYNSAKDGKYVSVVRDVHTGKTRTLPLPIYAVSPDGSQAVTCDFARLNRLRPGYGYCFLPEKKADDPAPEDMGIHWMNVKTGENRLLVSLKQAAASKPDERFKDAYHWFNHLQLSPGGKRFLFLHRWRPVTQPRWWTRLYTANPDGSDLRLVWDHDMVSHFDWRDDDSILAWARNADKKNAFFLYDLKADKMTQVGEGVLTRDGHCSYSPDRKWILNDTYPDQKRLQTLMLFRPSDGKRIDIGKFYLSPKLTGPFRCDLHPRWSRDGTQVCIDSAHSGARQLYVIDVGAIVKG